MPRYIDADILNREIDKFQSELESNNDAIWEINKPIYKGLCYARGIINDIPTADVVEVKHGEWIYDADCECFVCSKCVNSALNIYRLLSTSSNFCPHCGAKMDGERKE